MHYFSIFYLGLRKCKTLDLECDHLKTYPAKNNTVKPFHKLLEVRPDVLDGTLDLSVYAANLGDVVSKIDKPAARVPRPQIIQGDDI